MDKKSPDVRYICRISGWDFKHLAVKGWFRLLMFVIGVLLVFGAFQSPRGEGVVQTSGCAIFRTETAMFQSPRGVGVVQTGVLLRTFMNQ